MKFHLPFLHGNLADAPTSTTTVNTTSSTMMTCNVSSNDVKYRRGRCATTTTHSKALNVPCCDPAMVQWSYYGKPDSAAWNAPVKTMHAPYAHTGAFYASTAASPSPSPIETKYHVTQTTPLVRHVVSGHRASEPPPPPDMSLDNAHGIRMTPDLYMQQTRRPSPSALSTPSSSPIYDTSAVAASGFGPYRFVKTLGEGSYGKVKLAIHRHTGQEVAIKIIGKNSLKKPAHLVRIRREIALMKLLNPCCRTSMEALRCDGHNPSPRTGSHENLIQLFEVHETTHEIILVMEACHGGELLDYLEAQGGALPLDEARDLFRQLVSVISFLHGLGIVHRDLKPQNILLTTSAMPTSRNERPASRVVLKLIDFGFSATYSKVKPCSTWCGSPFYAAPEMVTGKAYVGPEVDVWSMGVILFCMATGGLPFTDKSSKGLYAKIAAGKFDLPLGEIPRVPGRSIDGSDGLAGPSPTPIRAQTLGMGDLGRATAAGGRKRGGVVVLPPLPPLTDVVKDLICRMLVVPTLKRASILDLERHPFLAGSAEPKPLALSWLGPISDEELELAIYTLSNTPAYASSSSSSAGGSGAVCANAATGVYNDWASPVVFSFPLDPHFLLVTKFIPTVPRIPASAGRPALHGVLPSRECASLSFPSERERHPVADIQYLYSMTAFYLVNMLQLYIDPCEMRARRFAYPPLQLFFMLLRS